MLSKLRCNPCPAGAYSLVGETSEQMENSEIAKTRNKGNDLLSERVWPEPNKIEGCEAHTR